MHIYAYTYLCIYIFICILIYYKLNIYIYLGMNAIALKGCHNRSHKTGCLREETRIRGNLSF